MTERSPPTAPVSALALLALTMQVAAASVPSPLALSCMGCHQASVNSPEMPALSSLTPAAIEASLKAERDQPQSGSIMARFAAKMSDAEIAQLALELGRPATDAAASSIDSSGRSKATSPPRVSIKPVNKVFRKP